MSEDISCRFWDIYIVKLEGIQIVQKSFVGTQEANDPIEAVGKQAKEWQNISEFKNVNPVFYVEPSQVQKVPESKPKQKREPRPPKTIIWRGEERIKRGQTITLKDSSGKVWKMKW